MGPFSFVALLWGVSLLSFAKCQDKPLAAVVRHLQTELTKMKVCMHHFIWNMKCVNEMPVLGVQTIFNYKYNILRGYDTIKLES